MLRSARGFLIILAFFIVPVAADASASPWSWNKYAGTSQWDVTITEDESYCGGGITTNRVSLSINHDFSNAKMGNVGHGEAPGTFISNNILHMPSRPVSETTGSSTLSAYDIYFTTDCSAFAGKYSWVYHGEGGYTCRGSTALSGVNSKGCPGVKEIPSVAPGVTPSVATQIASARKDLNSDLILRDLHEQVGNYATLIDRPGSGASAGEIADTKQLLTDITNDIQQREPPIEDKYNAILSTDPNNFWANWDMAELKKAQRNYPEYFRYTEKALANKNIAREKAEEVRKNIAGGLGISDFPTTQNSYFIKRMSTDADAIQSVYGIDAGKGEPDTEKLRIFAFWNQPYDAVNVVGLPK
ncbi:MAG: hypothetical protein WC586_01390 [Methanoregula sp.]